MVQTPPDPLPHHAAQVFACADILAIQGANQGDALAGPDGVCAGDLYQLRRVAEPLRLRLRQPVAGGQSVAPGSDVGNPGDPVTLEARYTLMAPDGDKVDLLILTVAAERVALPLSSIGVGVDYMLLKVEPAPQDLHLADVLCLSFARGTMITLGGGKQTAVETLRPGTQILTRDHGRQPVRWIGHARLRAVGSFAPVVIVAGTIGNAGDLIVSQHHRVFLYQRQRMAGLPMAELLVQARDLVDARTVYLREGGFVDYFSLVFDRHEIIYAEGVPSESLMVNEATVNRLPPEIAADVKARFPGLVHVPHFGTEASREFLAALGAAGLIGGRRS